MERPVPVKIVIFAYGALALFIIVASAYATYLGWIAENGTLSEYQSGFIKGMGFDLSTFGISDSGAYAGAMAPALLISLISLVFILKRWIIAFFVIFSLDAILFTGGIGYLFKIITAVLLLIPSSQDYFKNQSVKSPDNCEEIPNKSGKSDRIVPPF